MRLDVYNFLKKYIQDYMRDKFPMYYRAMKGKELNSFIQEIITNSVFNQYDIEAIKNGGADNIINNMINNYAQVKLTSIWANFGTLRDYIKGVILREEKNILEDINERTLDDIVMEMTLELCKKNESSYTQYMNRSYDKVFVDSFYGYCDKIKRDCYAQIKKVFTNLDIGSIYDNGTQEYLYDHIMKHLLRDPDINDLISGLNDQKIIETFPICLEEMKNEVRAHVMSVINTVDMHLLINVSVKSIVSEIVNATVETGKFSAYRLLSGKMDSDIVERVEREARENDPEPAKRHVSKMVRHFARYDLPVNVLEKFSFEIFNDLVGLGYTLNDIASGKYDNLISCYVDKKSMMYFSLPDEQNKNNRVKRTEKKRRMQKSVSMLLVVATLTSVLGVGTVIYHIGKSISDGIDDLASNMRYNSSVYKNGGSKYSTMFTKYSDEYEENIKYVIEDYNNYSKLGESYGYMGFYEFYKHVNSNALAIMDSMLHDINYRTFDEKRGTSLRVDADYFLEFAYNRLVEMGCEEIQQEKYIEAIDKYKEYDYSNLDENKTTLDCIKEKNDRKLLELINDIMNMYDKYSSKYFEQLSNLLGIGKSSGRSM